MDKQTAFTHYLGQDLATYRAGGAVTFERILQDLQTLHGRQAREMGLAFLVAELRDYAAAPALDPKDQKMIGRMLHELADQLTGGD
jgi:hypothetical protein